MGRIDINEQLLSETIEKLDRKITRLTSRLTTTANGRLVSDSINLQSAINMRKNIAKNFGPYFDTAKTVTDYRLAQKESGKILKDAGIPLKFTKADNAYVKAFSDDSFKQLVALGNQYSADISKKVYVAVSAGDTLDDLTLEIKQLLIGGTDKAGRPMTIHAQTISTTGYQEVDRTMLLRQSEDIEGVKYKYAGSSVKDTRKWCKDHAGKVFTREEISKWGDRTWQGKKQGDPFITMGGWNCRHRWLPIIKETE
jgi:hypothetical protein